LTGGGLCCSVLVHTSPTYSRSVFGWPSGSGGVRNDVYTCDDATMPDDTLPSAPPMRYGGAPITDAEALASHRRVQAARGLPIPDELPAHDARIVQTAHRFPPRLLARVRARAEMEGVTVTDVLRDALEAYAAASPGSRVTYPTPKRR